MFSSVQLSQSCRTLCDPMDCSMPGLPAHHQVLQFTQIHVHWVGDAIQPSHPLLPRLLLPSNFPSIRVFSMSWLFASGGQRLGASTSASLLSMNIQGWFPLGLTYLILHSKGLLQHHSSKAAVHQCLAFFMVQLSHPYMTTGKTMAFDWKDLCQQNNASAF